MQDTFGQPLNVAPMGFSDMADFFAAAGDIIDVEKRAGKAKGKTILRLKPEAEGG